jgi:hypothetical protein
MSIVCPQCQEDDAIQKVSAVIVGGTSASDLALALAPPLEPKKQSAMASFETIALGIVFAVPISCMCPALMIGVLGFGQKFDSTSSAITYISNWASCFLGLCFCAFLWWFFVKKASSLSEK